MDYELIDSGNFKKLERYGKYLIERPSPSAIWTPKKTAWRADLSFSRKEDNKWLFHSDVPNTWEIVIDGIKLKISMTSFGHLGLFPEHLSLCRWMKERIKKEKRQLKILNLFAYSGLATLYAAAHGASVCHVDASYPMIEWAKENAKLNRFEKKPIRWIVDDVFKFLKREIRRKIFYDGIILDPPSFGRGTKKEVFKIETDLKELLLLCKELLSGNFSFLMLSCHTNGLSSQVLCNILRETFSHGNIEGGEMMIASNDSYLLPAGFYARLQND